MFLNGNWMNQGDKNGDGVWSIEENMKHRLGLNVGKSRVGIRDDWR